MNAARLALLDQLAAAYAYHDQHVAQRGERYVNITPDTGPFLALLLQATNARAILEIGTSTGYSTLWLADASEATGGHVTTLELNAERATIARANFVRADLHERITSVVAPVQDWLADGSVGSFDFVFLDADRSQYVALWPRLLTMVKPGGLLVVDNALSHPEQLRSFTDLVHATPGVTSVTVPVGKGELLIWKELG